MKLKWLDEPEYERLPAPFRAEIDAIVAILEAYESERMCDCTGARDAVLRGLAVHVIEALGRLGFHRAVESSPERTDS